MYNEVKNLENLAIMMGFDHKDIIMLESLTTMETVEALIYGCCFNLKTKKKLNSLRLCFLYNRFKVKTRKRLFFLIQMTN